MVAWVASSVQDDQEFTRYKIQLRDSVKQGNRKSLTVTFVRYIFIKINVRVYALYLLTRNVPLLPTLTVEGNGRFEIRMKICIKIWMKIRLTLSVDNTQKSDDGGEDVTPHYFSFFSLLFLNTPRLLLFPVSNVVSLSTRAHESVGFFAQKRRTHCVLIVFPTYRVPVNRRGLFRPGRNSII